MTRAALAVLSLLLTLPVGAFAFTEFESGQVRPLALSPDGTKLFAVNTPDDQLEIFAVALDGSLTHTGSVPVGLEPVAVAARTNTEVWVVNHLSDDVSIVDLATTPPRVSRTLLVGDEPRDIVFAGTGGTSSAFITAAHRGQNRPGDPQLTTPGIGRADVWVFDATNPAAAPSIVTLFGDTPRALAVGDSGASVYAAVFHSGNQTTTINEGTVCNGGSGAAPCTVGGTTYPGGLPPPNTNFEGTTHPETGLVVKFNPANGHWEDRATPRRNWSNAVRFNLPDLDVFKLNANSPSDPPISFASVGTVLFNMAVNPSNGHVYVSNTDAHNEVRFEGPGVFGGSTVRGHLAEARISVLSQTPSPTVNALHLNKHIDYAVVPSPPDVAPKSLATPTGVAVTNAGDTLYVAAFGSSKVGIFDTTALENDTFVPSTTNQIVVTGGGPSGLVLNASNDRLYVFTRFDNAVSVIDTGAKTEIAHLLVHNPEPVSVVEGRPFLYDASFTSSNGEAACASCHIFGDFDSLAWDLGNPDDPVRTNPNPIRVPDPLGTAFVGFHPMKGPMTTQSLRGMAHSGPMHWRGDRTGGYVGQALNEGLAFRAFNVAFAGLLGRSGPLTDDDMAKFTDFILQVTYPPNPIRALDNSLTPDQTAGRNFFLASQASDIFQPCHGCHALDASQGFFGTDGFTSFENEPQLMKIPHLRNMYQKVGMFGMPQVQFINPGDNLTKGDQVRGFGFLHDGSVDTLFRFHNAFVFDQTVLGFPNPGGFPNGAAGNTLRRQMEAFMLAFDSDLAPIVGQQVTLRSDNSGAVGPSITRMIARAQALECDLVVKGTIVAGLFGPEARGWLYDTGSDRFVSDRTSESSLTDTALRNQAATANQERTYTCVPPGSGIRVGIDRDEDGFPDTDEVDAGTDPADPASFPGGSTTSTTSSTSLTTVTTVSTTSTTVSLFTLVQTTSLSLRDDATPPVHPSSRKVSFKSATRLDAQANRIAPPLPGGPGDPTLGGATVVVYNSAGATSDDVEIPIPAGLGWTILGSPSSFKGYRWKGTGAITSITVRPDSLVVKGGKASFGYTLDEPSQGRVAVRVVLGGNVGWCADAPGKAGSDRVNKFVAVKRTPAPGACPARP
jgi:YVTN family beta-propeller protein